MNTRLVRKRSIIAGLVLLGACGDSSTGPESPQNVSLSFRVVDAPASALVADGLARVGTVEGANGSLAFEQILLIVNEVELKHADGSCDTLAEPEPGDDCPEFEAPPRFLDLPLDGQPIAAVTSLIPPGAYKELDFEIEDLEDDEEDPAMAALIEQVRSEILVVVPDWPRKASAMIAGTFTPTGGSAEQFRVFVDAEIEIEFALTPNLVVGEDGTASRSLTVDVRPDLWFVDPTGNVRDLRMYDWDETGELIELEVEMEKGFTKIEIDDD